MRTLPQHKVQYSKTARVRASFQKGNPTKKKSLDLQVCAVWSTGLVSAERDVQEPPCMVAMFCSGEPCVPDKTDLDLGRINF